MSKSVGVTALMGKAAYWRIVKHWLTHRASAGENAMRWSGWGTRWERPGDGRLASTSQAHEQRPPGNVPPPALFILDMVASAQPARQYYVVSRGSGWDVASASNYLGR